MQNQSDVSERIQLKRKSGIENHVSRLFAATLPWIFIFYAVTYLPSPCCAAGRAAADTSRADAMLADYFRAETAKLHDRCLADVESSEDWQSKRKVYREQLFEMLGLMPVPEKTDLKPVITGRVEHERFTVENLHFQSRPGLYVTANLYIPKGLGEPVPTILYVCGHARVKKGGVSYGNKTAYQHHPAWFARNGYVCLIIDTLQLGEIEGIHHGTYREKMWWWNSRGYTSAGVEAWNCIRALDYLETRKEVDASRFGVTGRSGGGVYSWWVSALDGMRVWDVRRAIQALGQIEMLSSVPVALKARGVTAGIVLYASLFEPDIASVVLRDLPGSHRDGPIFLNVLRYTDIPHAAAIAAERTLLRIHPER